MPTLAAGEVHIWTARLPSCPTPDLEVTLSGTERDRARRFHFTKHRLAYVFAHAVLRDILSHYLHFCPPDIRFCENLFGKPSLVQTGSGGTLEFNLSHAGSLVLVALSGGRRIGVDVEEIRAVDDFSVIAESHFTPPECAFIFGHGPADREPAFFRCWTRKEAYIKAVGKGLSIALNSFDTLIASGQSGRRIAGGPDRPDVANWWLADLDVPNNYMAAVAVETGIDRLVYFDWQPNATTGGPTKRRNTY
jgi:4'-phosphopantetheinyl transferase